MDSELRSGTIIYTLPLMYYENLLHDSKFKDFQERHYDITLSRDIDETLGNLFSMSWAIKRQFGGREADFENELRQKLTAILHGQKLIEKVRFGLYTAVK